MREESVRGLVLSCPDERILCDRSVEATREFNAVKHRPDSADVFTRLRAKGSSMR